MNPKVKERDARWKGFTCAYFSPAKIRSAPACASSEVTRDRLSRRLSSHLVTKLNRAALVGFDLRQVEGDVSVELLEELDPITNHDREN